MPLVKKLGTGCSICMGDMKTYTHCCYCDTEAGRQIETLHKKIERLEADLHHWKSNHKYAVGIKRKVSEMYGKALLDNRILLQELNNEREKTQREGRPATSFFSKLKRVWNQLRYGI